MSVIVRPLMPVGHHSATNAHRSINNIVVFAGPTSQELNNGYHQPSLLTTVTSSSSPHHVSSMPNFRQPTNGTAYDDDAISTHSVSHQQSFRYFALIAYFQLFLFVFLKQIQSTAGYSKSSKTSIARFEWIWWFDTVDE